MYHNSFDLEWRTRQIMQEREQLYKLAALRGGCDRDNGGNANLVLPVFQAMVGVLRRLVRRSDSATSCAATVKAAH